MNIFKSYIRCFKECKIEIPNGIGLDNIENCNSDESILRICRTVLEDHIRNLSTQYDLSLTKDDHLSFIVYRHAQNNKKNRGFLHPNFHIALICGTYELSGKDSAYELSQT